MISRPLFLEPKASRQVGPPVRPRRDRFLETVGSTRGLPIHRSSKCPTRRLSLTSLYVGDRDPFLARTLFHLNCAGKGESPSTYLDLSAPSLCPFPFFPPTFPFLVPDRKPAGPPPKSAVQHLDMPASAPRLPIAIRKTLMPFPLAWMDHLPSPSPPLE